MEGLCLQSGSSLSKCFYGSSRVSSVNTRVIISDAHKQSLWCESLQRASNGRQTHFQQLKLQELHQEQRTTHHGVAESPLPYNHFVFERLCENGQLDLALFFLSSAYELNIIPPQEAYCSYMRACNKRRALSKALRLLLHLIFHGLESSTKLGEYLVITLIKCGGMNDALRVLLILSSPTALSWSAVICAFTDSGHDRQALKLYKFMQEERVLPNNYTFVSLFKACGNLLDLLEGRALHADARHKGLDVDVHVGSSLIHMYQRCGCVKEAETAFTKLTNPDIISCNAMLSAYNEQDQDKLVFSLYRQMQGEDIGYDKRTLGPVLQTCHKLVDEGLEEHLCALEIGQALHSDARANGFVSDVFVANNLLILYCKCGCILEAENLFAGLCKHDVVLWTTFILAYVEQGEEANALRMYRQMQEEGLIPSDRTYVAGLQACCMLAVKEDAILMGGRPVKVMALEIGKALHQDAQEQVSTSDIYVVTNLVNMYSKCGSILEAHSAFNSVLHFDIVLWTTMLSAYIEHGDGRSALSLYRQMQENGIYQNEHVIAMAVQAFCILIKEDEVVGMKRYLDIGKELHFDAIIKGFDYDAFVCSSLLTMYGMCGCTLETQVVFVSSYTGETMAWATLLAVYVKQGEVENALRLYRQMQEEQVCQNTQIHGLALESCSMLAEEGLLMVEKHLMDRRILEVVHSIHSDVRRKGFGSSIYILSILMSIYHKCERIAEAENAFDSLPYRDTVSWNIIISIYAQEGQAEKALLLYKTMQEEGVIPSERTFVIALKACCVLSDKEEAFLVGDIVEKQRGPKASLEIARALLCDAWNRGFGSQPFVLNSTIDMFGKCGSIEEAEEVFCAFPSYDSVSYNSMLSAYVSQGLGVKALRLFQQILNENLTCDEVTFTIAVQASSMIMEDEEIGENDESREKLCLEVGQAIHADAFRRGHCLDICLGSALVSLYSKSHCLKEAVAVFEGLLHHDMVSWNAILAAYVEEGQGWKALQLFKHLQEEGMCPNTQTFVSALQSCCLLAEKDDTYLMGGQAMALKIGKALHSDVNRMGLTSDVFVCSALVSVYGKCRSICESENAFFGASQRNVVLYNAMLTAYNEQLEAEKTLKLYKQMTHDDFMPDSVTLCCVLQASAMIGHVDICREVHFVAAYANCNQSSFLAASLIHAYGCCGGMVDAQVVFDYLHQPDLVAWSALIAGHAREGNLVACLEKFTLMQSEGIMPDQVTYASLLTACNHAGLAEKGFEVFESMILDHALIPEMEHYTGMIDMLGRSGNFKRMQTVLGRMPVKPDNVFWSSLLGVCQKHGYVYLGKQAFECVVQLHPKETTAYVMMSNMYADAGIGIGR